MLQESTLAIPTPARPATWIGLFLSLFSMLVVRQVFRLIAPHFGTAVTFLKEALIWMCAAALLWLVRNRERLALRSLGFGAFPWWKTALWGLVAAASCAVAVGLLVHTTGYGQGTPSRPFDRLPLWLMMLVVVRAGFVEELFFRGYAIERLQAVGLPRPAAVLIPLIIFAGAHWTGGLAGILIALVVGAVLTGFFLWRRDLPAVMLAHFLVDFVPNILPRLLS